MSDQPQDHPARRLSPRQTLLTALALSAITLATPVLLSTASAQSPGATAAAADPALPFDPPTAAMKASPKKVFAHYVTSLTVSLDNKNPDVDYYTKNYLNPDGEGGKHSAYGGFVRDRPLGRPARSEANWRAIDMRTEVQQAKDAGLDGFVLDIFAFPGDSSSQVAQNVTLLMDAAAAVDPSFKILLMPDVSGGLKAKDSDNLARLVAQLGKHSAAYKLTDGRLVVSPFHTESHDAAWWKTFTELLAGKYATPVAFMPLFLNSASNLDAYAPFSYGIADWGNRNPAGNNPTATHSSSPKARIKAVHDKGLKWMQPVSVQDERPRSGAFQEAENTQNLRNTWEVAIKNDAEFVQLTTWNDYVEGTSFAPSAQHRRTLLDINAYYMAIYKTGQAPQIKRDTIYLSHRVQPHAAKQSYPQSKMMRNVGTSPARDAVEALTFLTAPGTVTLTVGGTATSCNVPAGPATCTAPLTTGDVSATVTRNATVVSTVTSPFKVTNTPYVQDLGYVVTAGGQTATSAPKPAPQATAPGAPSQVSATAGNASASVAFTGPADNGGAPVTGYTVTSSPGGLTETGTASPLTVRGLTNGTSYTFTVTATNKAGKSAPSSPSNTVTPASSDRLNLNRIPARIVFGPRVALTGSVTRSDTSAPLGTVSLIGKLDNGTMQTVQTVEPRSSGAFRFTIRPLRNATYRVVYNGDDKNAGFSSNARRMLVAVKITASVASARANAPMVVKGAVGPDKAGRVVGLYRVLSGDRLQALGRARIASNGTYQVSGSLPQGNYTLQVGLGATKHNLPGVVRLAVRRS